jgi:hypothetical protein
LALATDSDTGISNSDQLTKDSAPTFTGIAETGTSVELFSGDDSLGTVTADALGDWSLTATTLVEGEHKIVAEATDAAGNVSVDSEALPITVDTNAPDAPLNLALAALSDTGVSSSDQLTNDTKPTFSGTAEAGASIELFSGDDSLGAVTADKSGSWTLTATSLSEGVHTIVAKATDAAGNVSVDSEALPITVDTTAPTLSAVTQWTQTVVANDTLVISFDEDIKLGSGYIALTDSGSDDTNTIDVADNGGQLATNGGQLTITPTKSGDYGSHYLTFDSQSITDVAGNAYVNVGEFTPDPAVDVVFNLMTGTSTDVDSRLFSEDETYNIYIMVDSAKAGVTLNEGNIWGDAQNLGSDDVVYLVGSDVFITDQGDDPATAATAASGNLIWYNSEEPGWLYNGPPVASLSGAGNFFRYGTFGNAPATGSAVIFDSWSSIANGGITSLSTGTTSPTLPTSTAPTISFNTTMFV